MRPVIEGQDGAVHRRDPNDANHRLDRQLKVFVPINMAVFDLDNPRLPAEFLPPDPIGEHADAGPEGGKAEIVELHLDDFDVQHVASFRAPHLDRAGGTVDERHGDVSLRQLLSEMAYRAVVDIDRAVDDAGFTRFDARNEAVIARKRVFDVAGFAATLKHFPSLA